MRIWSVSNQLTFIAVKPTQTINFTENFFLFLLRSLHVTGAQNAYTYTLHHLLLLHGLKVEGIRGEERKQKVSLFSYDCMPKKIGFD